jgi:paraquat-inducible protein B
MSADNKPVYSVIGFTVLAGVVAAVAALVWLGGFGGKGHTVLVESYYDYPVNGLSPGSPVNFRGVKIGEVKNIKISGTGAGKGDAVDAQRIRILMGIDVRKIGLRERPADEEVARIVTDLVSRGLRATVSSSGITGLSRVEFNFQANPPPAATLAWVPRVPLIPPSPSLMESFSDAATRVVNRLGKMDFMVVWSNVSTIAESAAHLVENADALVESQRTGLADIVKNVEEATGQLGELVRQLKENPSLLLRPADAAPLPETRWGEER